MRVIQVKQSGPLFLPYPLVFVQLLLLDNKFPIAFGLLRPLKPNLPQEHVQCEGPHHKTRIKGESGTRGLHAGPGVLQLITVAAAQPKGGKNWSEYNAMLESCWCIRGCTCVTPRVRGMVNSPAATAEYKTSQPKYPTGYFLSAIVALRLGEAKQRTTTASHNKNRAKFSPSATEKGATKPPEPFVWVNSQVRENKQWHSCPVNHWLQLCVGTVGES